MKGPSPKTAWAALLFSIPVCAAAEADSPLLQGWYVAPMYSHVKPDNDRMLDADGGGTLAIGKRVSESFALELYGVYGKLDRESGSSEPATMSGGGIGALAFLTDIVPGMYVPFAVGYLQTEHQALGDERYKGLSFEAGLGYLLPLSIGRYDFAVRAEGRYRHHNGQDGRRLDEEPSGLEDMLFNLGFQLPFGLVPLAPEPEAVRVVEPIVPSDSDGDGVSDDRDQCLNTPSGEAVDATGCSLPSPAPCGMPEPGHVSLEGCATGDVIVLRGVNFDLNMSSLTSDAMSILGGVARELAARPQIRVEIAGHTDAQGSDAYNQRLSLQRAETVRNYLIGEGVQSEQLTARGYGESRPVDSNDADEGRESNRRVELKIISGAGQ